MNGLWRFSSKAGAGVAKDAPPKQGFALLLDVLARNWWELIQLNLLIIVFCLPLITIPAALVAGARICAMMLEDRNVYLGRDFLDAFRRSFWRASALGLIGLATIGMSGYATFIFFQAARTSLVLALPLTISAATTIFVLIASAYAVALLALREQPLGRTIRLALLGALARPLPALAALGFVATLWVLHIVFYPVSIFMPTIFNFSFGMLAVTFGVHEAAVRLLALEGATEGETCAEGSA